MTTSGQTRLSSGVGYGQLERSVHDQWDGALVRFGRAAVLGLRTASRRRVFAPTLSVHRLEAARVRSPRTCGGSAANVGPPVATWNPGGAAGPAGPWDWHLRRELALRLLEQVAPAEPAGLAASVLVAWTRSGPAEQQDGDAAWWAATCSAAADVRLPVQNLVVVTRWGWWALPEGPEHYWERLRNRTAGAGRVSTASEGAAPAGP